MIGITPGPFEKTGAALPAVLEGRPIDGVLLGYQRGSVGAFLANALTVIAKSRRIGLTWGVASYAALEAAKARGGQDAFYIGYNLDMAREFIETCGMWAKAYGLAAAEVGEEVFEDSKGEKVQAFRITFASGNKIVALPSRPRSLRGMQGIVIIDEAAFHDALSEMLKAAMALLIWGGKVIVISTHDGIANPFNQLVDEIEAGRRRGKVVKITFADAMADGLYERVCLVKGEAPTPEGKVEWEADIRSFYGDDAAEELDCIPTQGEGSLIKPEHLAACEHDDAGKPELYSGGLVYAGEDVARRRDGQIQWVFELVGDVLWLRERIELVGQKFAVLTQNRDRCFTQYRVSSWWIDQTGMGEKVVEDAQAAHGGYRVHGVLLTGPNRLDLATSLVQRFENGLIRVPGDPVIRSDLRAIKKASGAQGQVRLVNEGDVHADRFWAAGLACRAADTPIGEFDYRAVPRRTALDQSFGDDDGGKRGEERRRRGEAEGGRAFARQIGAW